MSFNVSEEKEWTFQYKKIWNEVESQLFEKPIKRKYLRGKLKAWKESIRKVFMVKMFHTISIAMQRQC